MSDDAESRARAMSTAPWGWEWEEYPPVTPGRPFDLAAMLNVEFLPAGFWINPADMAITMGMRFAMPDWLAERIGEHPKGTSKGGQVFVNAMHLRGQLVTAVASAHRNGDADADDAFAACQEYDRQNERMAALLAAETERLRAEGRVIDTAEEYTPPPGSPLPEAHLSQLAADTRCFRALADWYTARTGCAPAVDSRELQLSGKPGGPARVPADTLEEYDIFTSQDVTSYMRALCDGRSMTNWTERKDDGAMVWDMAGIPFNMEVPPSPRAGLSAAELVAIQSVDSAWVVLYALNVLLKTGTPTSHSVPVVTLDIDDVIQKTRGYVPKRKEDRERARRETWLALLYGDTATIAGRRTHVYRRDGEAIDTQLSGPLFRLEWQTTRRDGTRGQTSLITSAADPTPIRVGYMLTRPAYAVLSNSGLIQYLPMADCLGAIPGGQPGGDWARAIGLTLFTEWRKKPRGRRRPFTRRELLYTYLPRTSPDEILTSTDHATRAIEYFQDALDYLATAGILERAGDVTEQWQSIRAGLPARKWVKNWLDAKVDVQPSPALQAAIKECADRLPPPPAPKALDAKPRKRRKKPVKREQ